MDLPLLHGQFSCRGSGGKGHTPTHLTRCHWPWAAAQAVVGKKRSCCSCGFHPHHQSRCHYCCCLQPRPASGAALGPWCPWSLCLHWHQHRREVLLLPAEHSWPSERPSCTGSACHVNEVETLCRDPGAQKCPSGKASQLMLTHVEFARPSGRTRASFSTQSCSSTCAEAKSRHMRLSSHGQIFPQAPHKQQ